MVDTPDHLREEPEFDIEKPALDAPADIAPDRTSFATWVLGILLVIAAGFAGYYLVGRSPVATEVKKVDAPAVPATDTPAAPSTPLATDAPPIDVPPLDQSDAVVRSLVKALSGNPRIAAWLTTDNLIRNFTVVVANAAEGTTPAKHLGVLRPATPFRVVTRGEDIRVDPRSFDRYNDLGAAAASVDAAGAARLYTALKPRIAEAYRDLGQPDTPFDRTLESAIVKLLDVPQVDGTMRLKPHGGTGYAFVDPALENLSPVQKQLLRTGPDNVRRIQTAIRAIAVALGIPESRLPTPKSLRGR
ncbi:MAG: DUF3014 domain-containing protein [Vicinamibacterales bacterium]